MKKVSMSNSDIYVINRDRLYATIRNVWDKSTDCLDEAQITNIYERLKALTNVDEATKQAHIDSINQRYGKSDNLNNTVEEPVKLNSRGTNEEAITRELEEMKARPEMLQSNMEKKICLRCGNGLVLRSAKKGQNAGQQFYGCSNIPKCRYIEK